VSFLAQCGLWDEKPYYLYVPESRLTPEREEKWQQTCATSEHGHACECETSISLANHEHLVKMEKLPDEAGTARKRMSAVPRTFSGIRWYSNYPEHYAGDARTATADKGRILRQLLVDSLAEHLAAVKADEVVPSLTREFFARVGE
jgi:creatinine amidohydrolase